MIENMLTLIELQEQIHEWASKTFQNQTVHSKIAHLIDEVQELKENPFDGEEMADIAILLLGIAELADVDLYHAIINKFQKNKNRTWGEPDERGVCKHIEQI